MINQLPSCRAPRATSVPGCVHPCLPAGSRTSAHCRPRRLVVNLASTQQREAPAANKLKSKAEQHGVSLMPLHKDFGVLVEGLDLRQPLSGEHQQLLYDLWREHLLLVFRAGYLDPGTQERVLRYLPHDAQAIDERRFCNAYFQPRVPSNPVLAVRGHNVSLKEHEGLNEEALKKCTLGGNPFDESRLWHMDMSDTPMPCEVSAMYMVQPAPDGGDDTLFTSTEKMFEDLDDATKQKVLHLETINRKASEIFGFHMNWEGTRRLDDFEAKVVPNHITAVGPSNTTGFVSCLGKYQPPAQYLHDCRLEAATEKGVKVELPPNPFVIKDPDNAKPAILISAQRIHHFEGMSRPDSLDLLEKVLTHGTSDDIIYKHEWQPNDFAIWANRRLIHTASPAKGFSHSEDKMRMYHLVFLDTNKPILPAADS